MKEFSKVYSSFFNSLNSVSEGVFQIDFEKLPNSVDYLSSGQATKTPRAIVAWLNARNKIEIRLNPHKGKTPLLVGEFISSAQDFTVTPNGNFRHIIFSEIYPLNLQFSLPCQ